jgi:hypothetical protein
VFIGGAKEPREPSNLKRDRPFTNVTTFAVHQGHADWTCAELLHEAGYPSNATLIDDGVDPPRIARACAMSALAACNDPIKMSFGRMRAPVPRVIYPQRVATESFVDDVFKVDRSEQRFGADEAHCGWRLEQQRNAFVGTLLVLA